MSLKTLQMDAALLSLDEATIREVTTRYGVRMPEETDSFWMTVHLARSGLKHLPEEAQAESKAWLNERGYLDAHGHGLPTREH